MLTCCACWQGADSLQRRSVCRSGQRCHCPPLSSNPASRKAAAGGPSTGDSFICISLCPAAQLPKSCSSQAWAVWYEAEHAELSLITEQGRHAGTSQCPESSLHVLLSVQASPLVHTLLRGLLARQGSPKAGVAADAATAVGSATAHIGAALETDPLLLVAALSLPGLSELPWPLAPADEHGPALTCYMSWLLGIGLAAVARLEAGSEPVEAAAGARAKPAVEAPAASAASQVGYGALRLQVPGPTCWSCGAAWKWPPCC